MQDHLKKYYGSLLAQSEKRPARKPGQKLTVPVRMNFKKKKDTVEVKAKAEETQDALKKTGKPTNDSYLSKLSSKLELYSKKDSFVSKPSNENKETPKPKSKPMGLLSLGQSNIVDLRIESLRDVIKPPQTITSMIESEYSEILSTENVVLSIRSIRVSKPSLANSE